MSWRLFVVSTPVTSQIVVTMRMGFASRSAAPTAPAAETGLGPASQIWTETGPATGARAVPVIEAAMETGIEVALGTGSAQARLPTGMHQATVGPAAPAFLVVLADLAALAAPDFLADLAALAFLVVLVVLAATEAASRPSRGSAVHRGAVPDRRSEIQGRSHRRQGPPAGRPYVPKRYRGCTAILHRGRGPAGMPPRHTAVTLVAHRHAAADR